MKLKDFNFLKWLCSIVMIAMGFVACSEDESDDIPVMYGTPTSDYKISGTVQTEKGKPIEGINVIFQGRNGGKPKDVLIIETDEDGKFSTEYINSFDTDIYYLKFVDVDGAENGGEFEEKTISVYDMQRTQVEKGEGWYRGKLEYYDDIELDLKPVESTDAPADSEENPDVEE